MEDFDNEKIIEWANKNFADVKAEIDNQGIQHRPKSPSPKSLRNSLTLKIYKRNNNVNRIAYGMPRTGVYVHKGVSRGHPITNPREAKKWFDIPTDRNFPDLQEIVAETSANYVINNLNIK